jgi:hypothetical protein
MGASHSRLLRSDILDMLGACTAGFGYPLLGHLVTRATERLAYMVLARAFASDIDWKDGALRVSVPGEEASWTEVGGMLAARMKTSEVWRRSDELNARLATCLERAWLDAVEAADAGAGPTPPPAQLFQRRLLYEIAVRLVEDFLVAAAARADGLLGVDRYARYGPSSLLPLTPKLYFFIPTQDEVNGVWDPSIRVRRTVLYHLLPHLAKGAEEVAMRRTARLLADALLVVADGRYTVAARLAAAVQRLVVGDGPKGGVQAVLQPRPRHAEGAPLEPSPPLEDSTLRVARASFREVYRSRAPAYQGVKGTVAAAAEAMLTAYQGAYGDVDEAEAAEEAAAAAGGGGDAALAIAKGRESFKAARVKHQKGLEEAVARDAARNKARNAWEASRVAKNQETAVGKP